MVMTIDDDDDDDDDDLNWIALMILLWTCDGSE